MTFFWQNPAPRIKKWVKDLLADRAAVEKAIGMPLREVLGCGHWGCVVDSKRPWVVKFTIDPNEAFVWIKINQLIEEERYGQGGVVRTDGIYQIEPRIMYGGRAKKAYAIVREEVAPVFTGFVRERGSWEPELTVATKKRLGINPDLRALYYQTGNNGYITVEDQRVPMKHPVDEFIATCVALTKFQHFASEWHSRFPYQSRQSKEHIKSQLERTTYRMMGGTGGAIGETLMMLVSNDIVLRDVHLFNIGWRKFDEIKDHGYEDKTLVIFDPGHTPTPRYAQIPVARVANPADDWQWFQEDKR